MLALLELPPEPFGEDAMLDIAPPAPPPPLPPPWRERVAALSDTPSLLDEAAAWVAAVPERAAGRVLGTVANPDHTYGPGPWWAGQRGDPSDAVRYGGATPGASAVAALSLAAAADVDLRVGLWRGLLVLESGKLRAFVGDCGPGVGPAPDAFTAEEVTWLAPEALVDLARLERMSGYMAVGDLDAALAVDAELDDPDAWPGYAPLRGSLLARQGVRLPGLSDADAAAAAAWAPDAPQSPLPDRGSCGDPWRVSPP
ncbi:MAG: hypothetical protein H6739_41385 [Alphaproteobacteria bacterium]|nr:hypothetical protein [Alphaproteobacteria bacterium]